MELFNAWVKSATTPAVSLFKCSDLGLAVACGAYFAVVQRGKGVRIVWA